VWLAKLVETANATPPPAPYGAATIQLAAKNIQFESTDISAPANAPFVITFKNDDPPTITHDVQIRDSGGQVLQTQDTIPGGTTTNYQYTPLAAGTYTFFCSVHSNMTGTLTVK